MMLNEKRHRRRETSIILRDLKTLYMIVKNHGIYCSNAVFQEYREERRKRERKGERGRDGLNIECDVLNTGFEVQCNEQK